MDVSLVSGLFNHINLLVVRCRDTFDVVYGDISLKGLLKKVSESGECRKTAKQYLKERGDDE